MEWYTIILILFGGMVLLLLTNLPIAFAFLVVNMVGAYFFLGGMPGLVGVVTGTFTSITTFTLLPVPFLHPHGGTDLPFRPGAERGQRAG